MEGLGMEKVYEVLEGINRRRRVLMEELFELDVKEYFVLYKEYPTTEKKEHNVFYEKHLKLIAENKGL